MCTFLYGLEYKVNRKWVRQLTDGINEAGSHLWRNVKYECVYLKAFDNAAQLKEALKRYFQWYNFELLASSLLKEMARSRFIDNAICTGNMICLGIYDPVDSRFRSTSNLQCTLIAKLCKLYPVTTML